MKESEILVIGAGGQLGSVLTTKYPNARSVDIQQLNISDFESISSYNWKNSKIVINAAAYTNVDGAETEDGRIVAWQSNAVAIANLVMICEENDLTLVHISTDYVFDGKRKVHDEEEPFSPLGVYGQTKAAGDIVLSTHKKKYILRTSWVIGEGNNFIRTMINIGKKGIDPVVVSDQIGRLTFTDELVRAIDYLLSNECPYGTYNVTNDGESVSWAEITTQVFKLANLKNKVKEISTHDYYKDKPEAAKRPLNSTLDLTKLHSTGFKSKSWSTSLESYVEKELQ
ncbi:MAG TPA: NAD(P)-dependent oxidoreductase [Candidatus Saccharimonadales bacterium]|nr:NAD(P)-dependent oxidoreductase [Candidatus Saccharimonadales bacterium]